MLEVEVGWIKIYYEITSPHLILLLSTIITLHIKRSLTIVTETKYFVVALELRKNSIVYIWKLQTMHLLIYFSGNDVLMVVMDKILFCTFIVTTSLS